MSAAADPQTLPFRYDRADFVSLARLGRPRVLRWLFALAWSLFALAAILIAISLVAGSSRVVIFIPMLLILLAIYLVLHRFGPDIGAWTIARLARQNDLLREQTMTVAEDCFRAESSRGKTEVRWSAIPRIHQEEARLFVYSTKRQAFIIPERAFANRDEFLAFADAANRRWKQHHRL